MCYRLLGSFWRQCAPHPGDNVILTHQCRWYQLLQPASIFSLPASHTVFTICSTCSCVTGNGFPCFSGICSHLQALLRSDRLWSIMFILLYQVLLDATPSAIGPKIAGSMVTSPKNIFLILPWNMPDVNWNITGYIYNRGIPHRSLQASINASSRSCRLNPAIHGLVARFDGRRYWRLVLLPVHPPVRSGRFATGSTGMRTHCIKIHQWFHKVQYHF